MKNRHDTTIHTASGSMIVTFEEQEDGKWVQVATREIKAAVEPVLESERRLPDGRMVHQPPPQELPVDPIYSDQLVEAQLQGAAVDKAKYEASKRT